MPPDYSKTPEATEATEIVQRTEVALKEFKVVTAADYETAASYLGKIKAGQKKIEELRTKITVPLNAALKAVNDLFRAPAAKLVAYEQQVKRAMLAYDDEQERLRREAQAKLDEAARKEQEKLNARATRAEEKGQTEKAEQLQQRAATVVAPVVERAVPKVAGVSSREVWNFEVTDPAQVPREYLMVDESKIRKVVQALKGDTVIAGVRVWSSKTLAASAA